MVDFIDVFETRWNKLIMHLYERGYRVTLLCINKVDMPKEVKGATFRCMGLKIPIETSGDVDPGSFSFEAHVLCKA